MWKNTKGDNHLNWYVTISRRIGYIKFIISSPLNLLFLTLIINKVGLEAFSTIAFVLTVQGMQPLFDLGYSKLLVIIESKRLKRLLAGFSLFFWIFVVIAPNLLMFAYFVLIDAINRFLGGSVYQLVIVLLIFTSSNLLCWYRARCEGLMGFHLNQVSFILNSILLYPGVYIILYLNDTVDYDIILSYMLFTQVCTILFVKLMITAISVKPKAHENKHLRKGRVILRSLKYIAPFYATNMVNSGFMPILRVFILSFGISQIFLSAFELAARIGSILAQFINIFSAPFFAIFAERKLAHSDVRRIVKDVFRKSFLLYTLLLVPLFTIVILSYFISFSYIDSELYNYIPVIAMISAAIASSAIFEIFIRRCMAFYEFGLVIGSKLVQIFVFIIIFGVGSYFFKFEIDFLLPISIFLAMVSSGFVLLYSSILVQGKEG